MVIKMRTDICNSSPSSIPINIGYKEHDSFLNTRESSPECDNFFHTSMTLQNYTQEAEAGIAQIKDPLWRRVCVDLLKILGPVAFKDLWQIKLMQFSSKERRAFLVCPNKILAETIEKYHFVILDALKKFYPALFSVETEICVHTHCPMH